MRERHGTKGRTDNTAARSVKFNVESKWDAAQSDVASAVAQIRRNPQFASRLLAAASFDEDSACSPAPALRSV